LEKPVGCIEALVMAYRNNGVTITNLIKDAGMSQKTAYSSLHKLMELGLLRDVEDRENGRKVRRYFPKERAERLAMYLDVACSTMKELETKNDIPSLTRLPVGSLAIMARIYDEGYTTITELREEAGMCGNTAYSALDALSKSGLIHKETINGFPRSVRYKLTTDGAYLGKILDLASIAMMLLDDERS
jgi:DNA-binding MarR family transcriptional regulator